MIKGESTEIILNEHDLISIEMCEIQNSADKKMNNKKSCDLLKDSN